VREPAAQHLRCHRRALHPAPLRQLTPEVLLGEAQKWLLAQHIVIGHANFPTVTSVYGQIIDILRQRSLQTATLDDVYFGPGHNRHA